MNYLTLDAYLSARAAETARVAVPERYTAAVDGALLIAAAAGDDLGAYTAEQIEAAYAALTHLEGVLAEAARTIDSYLGQRYPLPLTQRQVDAGPVRRHAKALARYYLHADHVAGPEDPVAKGRRAALDWLRDVVEKRASLGGGETSTPTRTGAAYIAGPDRVFGRGKGTL